MLIRKGGIIREIDEKRLQDYKNKGYEVIKTEKKPAAKKG